MSVKLALKHLRVAKEMISIFPFILDHFDQFRARNETLIFLTLFLSVKDVICHLIALSTCSHLYTSDAYYAYMI